MDLEAARSKQRVAQQQAQTQPDGVARIGDRDPLTGRYTVQFPDGGIGANGIKTYTAASKPGDIVVLFPRADGSIAIDSEKGSPTIVPDVFNKPVEEKRKAKVWILYEANGRLFVGGHDSTPVDVGVMPDPHYRPNYKFHVWGDNAGWVATWESCPRTVATFHTATNDGTTTTLSSTTIDLADYEFDPWPYPTQTIDWSFPLGAGFKAFRSIYYFPDVVARDPNLSQVSIGYLSAGIQTIAAPFIITTIYDTLSDPNASFVDLVQSMTISNPGTIKIPNIPIALTYAGEYSAINFDYQAYPGVILDRGLPPTAKSITIQSIYHYGILCDRSSTYYIKETVEAGSTTVNRLYELFSSSSNSLIARSISEPKFFGVRWDLRARTVFPFDYNDPIYYHSDPMAIGQLGDNRAAEPVGAYRRSIAGYNPLTSPALDKWYDYEGGTSVTFSGGSVVKIPALEIDRARFASGTFSRISMSPVGVETNLSPVFCYQIPFVAKIKHWSTTAS